MACFDTFSKIYMRAALRALETKKVRQHSLSWIQNIPVGIQDNFGSEYIVILEAMELSLAKGWLYGLRVTLL